LVSGLVSHIPNVTGQKSVGYFSHVNSTSF
jgi:hypothetical protein